MNRAVAAASLLLSLSGLSRAQENLVDNLYFKTGSVAFQKEDFARAAAEFQLTWSRLDSEANLLQRLAVASRLLESWYWNGDYQNAVVWYRAHQNLFLNTEAEGALQWVALSMLEGGFYAESAALFRDLGRDTSRARTRKMAIYEAHAHFRSGAAEKAYRVLHPEFAEPETPEEAYFYAGVAYETKRWKETVSLCDRILRDGTNRFGEKATLLKARSLAEQKNRELAVTLLLDLIGNTFDTEVLFRAFELLVESASAQESDRIRDKLILWSQDTLFPDRQLAAQYYGILFDSDSDGERLATRLDSFIFEHENHALAEEAKLMLGSLRPERAREWTLGETETEASRKLQERLNFETAVRQFQEASFSVAKESFLEISSRLEGREREQALFNSAIAALYAGDDETFDALEKELGKYSRVASAMHADLLFLGGLFYASQASQKAFNLLSGFVQGYPDHVSVVDAELALAELHLNQVPPQPQAARKIFDALDKKPLPEKKRERLDYAKLWAALLSPGSIEVKDVASGFLADWPSSRFRPEVSMLMASDYYEKRKFEEAEKAFRQIADEFPGSRFEDPALFFAAKSATLRAHEDVTDARDAIDGWDRVISNRSSLANHARHQKALALTRRDRYDEALRVFDSILKTKEPISDDLRLAVKSDKGFALFLKALALGADSAFLKRAAGVFAEVERDESAPRAWRYQASVRRAKCLELLGDEEAALALYQKVTQVSAELSPGGSPLEENDWLYRAGFFAMEILEKKEDWAGAVKLGEALSQRSGPGALEAGRRAERLRLRYFVWD